jgi:hypothetical protein
MRLAGAGLLLNFISFPFGLVRTANFTEVQINFCFVMAILFYNYELRSKNATAQNNKQYPNM